MRDAKLVSGFGDFFDDAADLEDAGRFGIRGGGFCLRLFGRRTTSACKEDAEGKELCQEAVDHTFLEKKDRAKSE